MKLVVKDDRFHFVNLPFDRKEEARGVGAYFSDAKNLWVCPANIISAVGIMSTTKDNAYEDDLEQLYDWMETVFNAKRQALQGLTPNGKETLMKNTPMPHQGTGYKRILWQKRLGAWWDMGVGKTYFALWVAQHLYEFDHKGRNIVMCPLSLISTWKDEMLAHLNVPYKVYECVGTKKKKQGIIEAWKMAATGNLIFLVCSWDTTKSLVKELKDVRIDYVIGDETGFIKNHAAQRTKAAIAIADMAEYKVALNGTPYVSDVRDLWSQMRFLSEEYAGASYWRFVNRYVQFDNSPWHKPIGLRQEMKGELKRLLDVIGMVVKKEDVLKDLPPKTVQFRWVEAEGEQKKALDKAMNEFEFAVKAFKSGAKTRSEENVAIKNAMARATRVQQITMGWTKNEAGEIIRFQENPKLDAVLDIAESSGQQKVVLFSRFVEDLKIMHEGLTKVGRKPVVYYGGLSHKEADAAKYSFTHGEADFFLSQVQKGGFGLNLQMSSIGGFLTNWWSWGVRQQAEGRLHRKGQTNPVMYFDIMMRNSIDEKIVESFKHGTSLVNYLFGKDLGDKDLEDMFK